jgi:hypothetical protein
MYYLYSHIQGNLCISKIWVSHWDQGVGTDLNISFVSIKQLNGKKCYLFQDFKEEFVVTVPFM